jgi:hypothetical protein
MKTRGMAAVAFIVGMGARAEDAAQLPVNDPHVIAAIKAAWRQSANGLLGTEAAFRLDGDPSDYKIVAAGFTNERMKQRLMIVPGRTFAVFHVHPTNGEPTPSRQDRNLADKYRLKILTLHVRGLFEYDPVEKKTIKVREGLGWLASSQTTS